MEFDVPRNIVISICPRIGWISVNNLINLYYGGKSAYIFVFCIFKK